MIRFSDLSIRKKLVISIMGTSAVAVLVACFSLYSLTLNHYKDSYYTDIKSLTDVIGFNCQAAILFNIVDDAEQVLHALEKRKSVVAANVFDYDHNLIASYGDYKYLGVHPETHHTDELNEFAPEGTLMIHEDIYMEGEKLGCITVIDNMAAIKMFNRVAMSTLAVVVVLIFGLSFIAATKIRDKISKPISELSAISAEISAKEDYSLRAMKTSSDEVGQLVVAFNDMLDKISDRTNELQKSEQRFRALIEQAVDSIYLHDMDGAIIDINQRACESLGYSREELLALTVKHIEVDGEGTTSREKVWSKMALNVPVTYVSRYQRKNGDTFPVEIRAGLVEFDDTRVILAIVRDLTERIKAEEDKHHLEVQLQQAQKMESIGTLAAGIAHDFNNILSPIYGYVELAQLKVQDDPVVKEYLSEVHKASLRATDLVKQILTFSRQDSEKFSPVEVHVIIKEALKLLRASIPTTIDIRHEIDPKSGHVMANPTQIHQVLMNLCTNAYHAMRENGGILGVSLKPVTISADDFTRNIDLRPGRYVMLEVSDTGIGMDKQTVSRIFEPYYTTKEQGEGTGMGLSVVHGIVKSHGGDITVYSEPGKGSTFHVYLPLMEGHEKIEEEVTEVTLATGVERILLIDDELSVAKVEKDMLESLGYQVEIYSVPQEALDHFREQPDRYDLVITDMTMPKMTGDKLAREIMDIRPDMPVVLCTGFSELINREEALKLGIRAFVTKPIIIKNFARTLREVFERRA